MGDQQSEVDNCSLSRYVNVGLFYLRQLFFAKYDIKVHTDQGQSITFFNFLILNPILCVGSGRRLYKTLEFPSGECFPCEGRQALSRPSDLRAYHRRLRRRILWVKLCK